MDIKDLPDWALLRIAQITSQEETDKQKKRVGLLAVSRSSWLALIAEKKIPPGRKLDPNVRNSPRVWTMAEVRQAAEKIAQQAG